MSPPKSSRTPGRVRASCDRSMTFWCLRLCSSANSFFLCDASGTAFRIAISSRKSLLSSRLQSSRLKRRQGCLDDEVVPSSDDDNDNKSCEQTESLQHGHGRITVGLSSICARKTSFCLDTLPVTIPGHSEIEFCLSLLFEQRFHDFPPVYIIYIVFRFFQCCPSGG